MSKPAAISRPREFSLLEGEVCGKCENRFMVLLDRGAVRADLADGCLVSPEVGDRVLTAWSPPQAAYILTVLTRVDRNKPAHINIRSDTAVNVDGSLDVQARNINLIGADALRMDASDFELNALTGRTRFGRFSFWGGLVKSRMDQITATFRTSEIIAERWFSRVKRSYRRIEEFEETKAGRLRLLVKELFHLGSKNTMIGAEEKIKMDADKIHLG